MTMTLDTSQQQRFGPPMSFDYAAHAQPAFSNPWSSSSSPPQSAATAGNPLFVPGHQQPGMNHSIMAAKPHPGRASTSSASSMASYGSMPVATTSAGKRDAHPLGGGVVRGQCDLLGVHQDLMSMSRLHTTSAGYADATYATSASPVSGHFAPTSAAPYEAMGYAPAPGRPGFAMGPEADSARRFSQQQSVPFISAQWCVELGADCVITETCRRIQMTGGVLPTLSMPATACLP